MPTMFDNKTEEKPNPAKVFHHVRGGVLPLRPGTTLHKSEKDDLAVFGWQEGDPVPPDFAQRIDAAKRVVDADINSGEFYDFGPTGEKIPLKVPNFKPPSPIPIEQLPEDRRQALMEYLKQYKEMAPQIAQAAQNMASMEGLDPSIQEAIMTAAREDGIEIIDSSKPQVTIPAEKEPEPEEEPKTPEEQNDLANFAISILGQKPFVKEYNLFGNRVLVTFRSLTSQQENLIESRLSYEQTNKLIKNQDDLVRWAKNYYLALSLDSVRAGTFFDVSTTVEREVNKPDGLDHSVLPKVVKDLMAMSPFDKGFVWNAVLAANQKFHDLVSKLEKEADKPDFWRAIED